MIAPTLLNFSTSLSLLLSSSSSAFCHNTQTHNKYNVPQNISQKKEASGKRGYMMILDFLSKLAGFEHVTLK